MFSKMMELVNRTDSHPLTPPQQKDVLDYAKSLARRFHAARQIEQSEPKILDAAVRHIQESSPDLGDFVEAGWESSANDLRFVLRTVTQAMLLDDDRFAGDVAVGSLTKQFAYLDLPSDATRGSCPACNGRAASACPLRRPKR
jgi:hypothetical protein